ncbi:biotin transporter BioY [Pedobacter sp. AK013]|nr:biotin transporter BioY [Pedobacter sp. AK013]
MIIRFIYSFLVAIVGIFILSLLCTIQQPSFNPIDLFLMVLFYYLPGMYILIVISIFLIHLIRQNKVLSRFLKTNTGFFLTFLAFVLISSIVKDKIVSDYEFIINFVIAYIISMLFYFQSLRIFTAKNNL